jgi:hypothetical protein
VANSSVSVRGLATWDSWGAAGSVEVGLWDSSQNLLASASVSNSSPTIGSANWSYTNIAPVALTAGDTYYVGSYGSDANFAGYTDDFTVDSRITYVQDVYTYGAFAFPCASSGISAALGGGDFGGNVILGTPASSILGAPEPSTWAMFLLGFAGLGATGYRRARARASHACQLGLCPGHLPWEAASATFIRRRGGRRRLQIPLTGAPPLWVPVDGGTSF